MKVRTENFNRQEYKTPGRFESPNLNYAFNTEYQETAVFLNQTNPAGLPDKVLAGIGSSLNKAFLSAANNNAAVKEILDYGNRMSGFFKDIQAKQFSVYVCYPGLQIGTGYPHKTKQVKGEIQVGALFDWTTGAPYYPGSSVKGVLRNIFKIASGDGVEADGCRYDLTERIKAVNPAADWTVTKEKAEYLKNILFGNDPKNQSALPLDERNLFYDAYIVGFRKTASGQQKKILGLDSLAPHESRVKNPIPINMLRILPDVCLTFNMILNDVKDPDGKVLLTGDQLRDLFKGIILNLGFGARTRTGYGIVKEIDQEDILREPSFSREDSPDTVARSHVIQSGLSINSGISSNSSVGSAHEIRNPYNDLPDASGSQEAVTRGPQDQNERLHCPKCGSVIIETRDGRIICKGKCGMLYGKAYGEKLTFEQVKLLLKGCEVRTPGGKVLSVDQNNIFSEFTTSSGQIKYRLNFSKPGKSR